MAQKQKNPMEMFQDFQQRMMEVSKGFMGGQNPFNMMNTGDVSSMMDNWKSMQEKMTEFHQEWVKSASESMESVWQMVPAVGNKEIYDKLKEVNEAYADLMSFWAETALKVPGSVDMEKWQELSRNWMNKYYELINSCFTAGQAESTRETKSSAKASSGSSKQS